MRKQDFMLTVVYTDLEIGNYFYYGLPVALSEYVRIKQSILHNEGVYLSVTLSRYYPEGDYYDTYFFYKKSS